MYDLEYGERAGRIAGRDLNQLTPNEERLIEALQTRFGSADSGNGNPLTVYCGLNDYVFIQGNHADGFYIPFSDCYSV
jgi:hypothetical protein